LATPRAKVPAVIVVPPVKVLALVSVSATGKPFVLLRLL
jgi:hypothetical protein